MQQPNTMILAPWPCRGAEHQRQRETKHSVTCTMAMGVSEPTHGQINVSLKEPRLSTY